MKPILPNELWMVILFCMDRRTLKAARLACRLFYELSMEAMLREITWLSKAKALREADYWEHNPNHANFPQDLAVCFADPPPEGTCSVSAGEQTRILNCIRGFPRLEALDLSIGNFPEDLYHVLADLSALKELTLRYCALPPSLTSVPVAILPNRNITSLKLFGLKSYPYRSANTFTADPVPCAGLFSLLPRLRSLHLELSFVETPFLPPSHRLTQLTIGVPSSAVYINHFLEILRSIPQLERLTTYDREKPGHEADANNANASAVPTAPPALNYLTHYTGTTALALEALKAAPSLIDVCIVADSSRLLVDFVEFLDQRQIPARRLRLEVTYWGSDTVEALRAIAYRLPGLECLAVAYSNGQPSEDSLVQIGVDFFPRLVNLQEFEIAYKIDATVRVPHLDSDVDSDDDDPFLDELNLTQADDLSIDEGEYFAANEGLASDELSHPLNLRQAPADNSLEPEFTALLFVLPRHNPGLQRICLPVGKTHRVVHKRNPSTGRWITFTLTV
ncbi:hypothetical protein C8F04DRAFT_1123474 [Mycena alexandri]|uniref:F-box domain-containing protein n=1 Tax=Mycena alexandri TaxID=1745969 RepID=A0AAD6SH78_9AGAR|nr:hypothetical protein C8F04DRAFT_1123474 [Mycena alexandri]